MIIINYPFIASSVDIKPSIHSIESNLTLPVLKQVIGKSLNPSLSFNSFITFFAFSSEEKIPINLISSIIFPLYVYSYL